MSEKRFTVESGLIIDTDNDDCLCDIQDTEIIVNTLNAWNKLIGEQQATINRLKCINKQLEERFDKSIVLDMKRCELEQKISEQQATIQLLKDFIKKEFPKSYKHILEGLDE